MGISVKRRTAFIIGGSGVGLVIIAVLLGWVVVPMILKMKVEETVAIREGTETFERWANPPVTLLYRVYFFEVLNPDGIAKGERPKLQEKGPFVYRERRSKKNIQMFENEDRAVYMQKTEFHFAKDLSVASDDTELTLLNIPALLFAQVAETVPGFNQLIPLYNKVIHKMFPFTPFGPAFAKIKVRDYLFDGVKMSCKHETGKDNIERLLWKALCIAYEYMRPTKTVLIDDGEPGINTFAFFKYKNTTLDGPYEVRLGLKNSDQIGEIITYMGKKDLAGMWGGEACNRLTGTDSTVFRPFLQKVDTITAYNGDICRSIDLTYQGKSEFKGIPTRRYGTGKRTLASVLDNPDNYCYCPRPVKGMSLRNGCLKSGMLDLSSCQGGPVYLSYPHFFMSDPYYQSKVDGLNPNATRHEIFVELEPYSGYPIRAGLRAQMNVFLKAIPQVDCMKNFDNSILPLVWIDEGVELPDELVDEVKSRLLNLLRIADIGIWVMIGVGAAATLASIVLFATGSVKRSKPNHSAT